jgi:hypothetical protein
MIPELGLTVYLITLAQSGSPVLSQYAAETVGDSDMYPPRNPDLLVYRAYIKS